MPRINNSGGIAWYLFVKCCHISRHVKFSREGLLFCDLRMVASSLSLLISFLYSLIYFLYSCIRFVCCVLAKLAALSLLANLLICIELEFVF